MAYVPAGSLCPCLHSAVSEPAPLCAGGQAVHCWRGLTDSMHRERLLQVAAIDTVDCVTPEPAQGDRLVGFCQSFAAVPLHGTPGIVDANHSQGT